MFCFYKAIEIHRTSPQIFADIFSKTIFPTSMEQNVFLLFYILRIIGDFYSDYIILAILLFMKLKYN